MSKIKTMPVGLNAFGKDTNKIFVSPKFKEIVTGNGENFVPYREFELNGDSQHGVPVRVYGLSNSDEPKKKGLTRVKFINGLRFVTRLVGTKEEVQLEASDIRFEK